jgi:hypothetical protein
MSALLILLLNLDNVIFFCNDPQTLREGQLFRQYGRSRHGKDDKDKDTDTHG